MLGKIHLIENYNQLYEDQMEEKSSMKKGNHLFMRSIAYILIMVMFSMLLGGCGSKTKEQKTNDLTSNKSSEANDNVSKGRYFEKSIDLPSLDENELAVKVVQNKENSIELYTYHQVETKIENNCYLLKEDMSWEKTTPGWLNNQSVSNMMLLDICLGQDGYFYACFQSINGEQKASILKEQTKDEGQLLDLAYLNKPLSSEDGMNLYAVPESMGVLENGNIAFLFRQSRQSLSVVIMNQQGEKVDEIILNDLQNFMVSGNRIIVLDQDNKIAYYNTETKCNDQTLEFENSTGTLMYAEKEDGTLIVGDSAGIHRMKNGGSLWETTVDGELNSMSMPSLSMKGLYVTEGDTESYYVSYQEGKGGMLSLVGGNLVLKQYVYDENLSAVPEKEITVYSLKENSTIRQAIALFQSKNPNVRINYIVAISEEGGIASDYIRTLNTELFAGNGADILILDGLPVNAYIEKGVLTDLSDMLNPMIESGQLLTNISNVYQQDGTIYQMPVRITVPIIVGNQEAVAASSNLESIARYITNNTAIPFMKKVATADLVSDYLTLNMCSLFKDEALDEGALKSFLENLKILNDNMQQKDTMSKELENSILFSPEAFRNIASVEKVFKVDMINIKQVEELMLPFGAVKERQLTYNTLNESFVPVGLAGLNSNSKEMELSKEFISFLFSNDVQKLNLNDGFPVVNHSLKQWFEENQGQNSMGSFDELDNFISGFWPTKQERDDMLNKIEQLKNPIIENQVLNDMIGNEALPYLNGEEDINKAISDIKNKVNIYLAE